MPLITREINNTGKPILDAKGTPVVGAKIEFQLVRDMAPSDSFDLTSGERVISQKHAATTDENGEFSIDLWPTSRGEGGIAYLCSFAGRPVFSSPLQEDDLSPLSWFDFYESGANVSAAEVSAFQSHIKNLLIHHLHNNKSILDLFTVDQTGNLFFAGEVIGGIDDETLAAINAALADRVRGTVRVSIGEDLRPSEERSDGDLLFTDDPSDPSVLMPTVNEKAAMTASENPGAGNPFMTATAVASAVVIPTFISMPDPLPVGFFIVDSGV